MYIAVIRYLPIHLHQVICRLVYSDGITTVHLALLNVDTLYTNLNAHSRESCRYNNVFMKLKWNYKCHYLNFGSLNQTHVAMQYVLVCQTTLLCVFVIALCSYDRIQWVSAKLIHMWSLLWPHWSNSCLVLGEEIVIEVCAYKISIYLWQLFVN